MYNCAFSPSCSEAWPWAGLRSCRKGSVSISSLSPPAFLLCFCQISCLVLDCPSVVEERGRGGKRGRKVLPIGTIVSWLHAFWAWQWGRAVSLAGAFVEVFGNLLINVCLSLQFSWPRPVRLYPSWLFEVARYLVPSSASLCWAVLTSPGSPLRQDLK